MLRAVELRFARYFVAGFCLDVVAAGGGAGFRWHGGGGFMGEMVGLVDDEGGFTPAIWMFGDLCALSFLWG